jgi:hypothetical protein
MSRSPGRYHSQQVPCCDCISVSPTDTQRRFLGYSARSHATYAAADPLLSEAALRQLGFKPIPSILLVRAGHVSYHLLRRFVDAAFLRFHKNSPN